MHLLSGEPMHDLSGVDKRARELSPGTSPHVERVRNTTGGSPDKWRKA